MRLASGLGCSAAECRRTPNQPSTSRTYVTSSGAGHLHPTPPILLLWVRG
jgi:hypothetical protein